MKIFYFSGTKLPSQNAQSIHVMKMAQAFAKEGHDVTLFAKGGSGAASEDIFNIYDTDMCFKLYMSSNWPLPFVSSAKRLLEFSNLMKKMGRPDMIFGHDPVALAMLAPTDIPILFEAHEVPAQSTQNWAFTKLLRNYNIRGIVTVSDVLKQELLNKYHELEPENIFVAPDGADLVENIKAKCKEDSSLRGRKNAFNVGYAGSMLPGKGVSMVARIAKLRPQYDFHILGGSKKQVQKLETRMHLPNMYFYGYRDHAEVPSYLKAFDVCLAPYQHRALIKTGRNVSRWISPMKVFEYMAVEKPIIASKLDVIEEILTHNVTGLLLPASDEEKWAKNIDMLREHPDLATKLAENAHRSLEDRYTWDKRADAIMGFYHNGKKAIHKNYDKLVTRA